VFSVGLGGGGGGGGLEYKLTTWSLAEIFSYLHSGGSE
jgi:hypothetical protein